MLWSKVGPRLTLFTTHLAGAAFGAASVVWALRFHNFFAALPWCICAVVAVPIVAGALFRRFLNCFGAAGQRRLVRDRPVPISDRPRSRRFWVLRDTSTRTESHRAVSGTVCFRLTP